MKVACDFSVFKAVNKKIEITFRSGGFIIRKLQYLPAYKNLYLRTC